MNYSKTLLPSHNPLKEKPSSVAVFLCMVTSMVGIGYPISGIALQGVEMGEYRHRPRATLAYACEDQVAGTPR